MKYGFQLEYPKPEDYVLGFASRLDREVLQLDRDWTPYLPVKEYQNLNGIEPYACVIFTILNCCEILIKRKYGLDRNYSDRFLATVVDTRGRGSAPTEAAEFLRKIGVPPQDAWPFDSSVNTEDKFFEKIPPKLYQIAREFLDEWEFGYEFVPPDKLEEAIQYSPLLISVYAWTRDEHGLYFKPYGVNDIHATTYKKTIPNVARQVFDTYDNEIKDYRWDSIPQMAMRFSIKKKEPKEKGLGRRLWEKFIYFWD